MSCSTVGEGGEKDGGFGLKQLEDTADSSLGSGCTGQLPQPHLRVFPQLPSPDELPANVKQAYRAFAAVPTVHPPEDNGTQVCAVVPCCCSCMLCLGWVPRVSAPKRSTNQV